MSFNVSPTPPIASLLALGGTGASESGGLVLEGGFAALLANQLPATTADALPDTGKILPPIRQGRASQEDLSPAVETEAEGEEALDTVPALAAPMTALLLPAGLPEVAQGQQPTSATAVAVSEPKPSPPILQALTRKQQPPSASVEKQPIALAPRLPTSGARTTAAYSSEGGRDALPIIVDVPATNPLMVVARTITDGQRQVPTGSQASQQTLAKPPVIGVIVMADLATAATVRAQPSQRAAGFQLTVSSVSSENASSSSLRLSGAAEHVVSLAAGLAGDEPTPVQLPAPAGALPKTESVLGLRTDEAGKGAVSPAHLSDALVRQQLSSATIPDERPQASEASQSSPSEFELFQTQAVKPSTTSRIVASAPSPGPADERRAKPSPSVSDSGSQLGSDLIQPRPVDQRSVTSAQAAEPVSFAAERAVELVEMIQNIRSEGRGEAVSISIDHDDFGPIKVSFESAGDGLVVDFQTEDPEVKRLINDAVPTLRSSGEAVGLRFDRHDGTAAGNSSNGGTSRDAHRHGAEHAGAQQTFTNKQSRRAAGERDGIFA